MSCKRHCHKGSNSTEGVIFWYFKQCCSKVATDVKYKTNLRTRSWSRQFCTIRKIVGSIPDVVIGIFLWLKLSGRTTFLGSTQPLTRFDTRNNCWGGKSGRCLGLTTLAPCVVMNSGSVDLQESSGPVQGCNAAPLRSVFPYRNVSVGQMVYKYYQYWKLRWKLYGLKWAWLNSRYCPGNCQEEWWKQRRTSSL